MNTGFYDQYDSHTHYELLSESNFNCKNSEGYRGNICNQNLIQQVAYGMFDYDSDSLHKSLYSLQIL